MISRRQSFALDQMRWIAAVAVLLHHARHHSVGEMAGVPLSAAGQVFGLATSYGALAVVIFFVLSGVLVGGAVLTRPLQRDRYVVDRASRICAVAFPALIFAFAVNGALQATFGDAYGSAGFGCVMSLGDLLTHALFLNNGYVETSCAIGPYWSLHNEVFYYLLWPLIVLGLRGQRMLLVLAGAILLSLAVRRDFGPHSTLLYFPIWIVGALMVIPRVRAVLSRLDWRAALVGLAAVLLGLKLLGQSYAGDWVAALMTVALLGALGRPTEWTPPLWLERFGKWAAGWSFSLYLFHGPAIIAVRTVLERGLGWQLGHLDAIGVAGFSIMTAAGLGAGYAASLLFERHTRGVRAWLSRRTPLASPAG